MAASEDRSEKPTQRRIEKAREDGRVVSSRYLIIALQALTAYFFVFKDPGDAATRLLQTWCEAFREVFASQTPQSALIQIGASVQSNLLPWFTRIIGFTACASVIAQVGASQGVIRAKGLAPDPKKLFMIGKLTEGYTGIHKKLSLFLVAAVTVLALSLLPSFQSAPMIEALRGLPLGAQIAYFGDGLLHGVKWAMALFITIGLIDFGMKIKKHQDELKMTKKEVQDESKESNGNPLIKAALRRKMKAMLSNRMMQQIPEATVVVVNPTHFAVALQYDPDSSDAPMVTAKGVDFLALRMRRKAEDCGVPVVENPPLAQSLYKSAEVGQKIPVELYRAVAEVLAYVYRVLGRKVPVTA